MWKSRINPGDVVSTQDYSAANRGHLAGKFWSVQEERVRKRQREGLLEWLLRIGGPGVDNGYLPQNVQQHEAPLHPRLASGDF